MIIKWQRSALVGVYTVRLTGHHKSLTRFFGSKKSWSSYITSWNFGICKPRIQTVDEVIPHHQLFFTAFADFLWRWKLDHKVRTLKCSLKEAASERSVAWDEEGSSSDRLSHKFRTNFWKVQPKCIWKSILAMVSWILRKNFSPELFTRARSLKEHTPPKKLLCLSNFLSLSNSLP